MSNSNLKPATITVLNEEVLLQLNVCKPQVGFQNAT